MYKMDKRLIGLMCKLLIQTDYMFFKIKILINKIDIGHTQVIYTRGNMNAGGGLFIKAKKKLSLAFRISVSCFFLLRIIRCNGYAHVL